MGEAVGGLATVACRIAITTLIATHSETGDPVWSQEWKDC